MLILDAEQLFAREGRRHPAGIQDRGLRGQADGLAPAVGGRGEDRDRAPASDQTGSAAARFAPGSTSGTTDPVTPTPDS